MDMQTLFKIIVLAIVSLVGGLLYPIIVNLLIIADTLPTDSVSDNFGMEMTRKAAAVWMGSSLLGVGYLFARQKSRLVFLMCPLLAPSLFAVLYVLSYS